MGRGEHGKHTANGTRRSDCGRGTQRWVRAGLFAHGALSGRRRLAELSAVDQCELEAVREVGLHTCKEKERDGGALEASLIDVRGAGRDEADPNRTKTQDYRR